MRRLAWIIGLVVFVAVFAFFEYSGYRSLKEILTALQREVNAATKLAQEESAAVSAASRRTEEAAARAEIAARGRVQAEQQRQQAESGREQAMNAAQQANEQARMAQDQMVQMRREREEELNRMQEALNRVVETHRTPKGMVMVLPNSIFRFDFDSSELSQRNRELLSRIAGIRWSQKLTAFRYLATPMTSALRSTTNSCHYVVRRQSRTILRIQALTLSSSMSKVTARPVLL